MEIIYFVASLGNKLSVENMQKIEKFLHLIEFTSGLFPFLLSFFFLSYIGFRGAAEFMKMLWQKDLVYLNIQRPSLYSKKKRRKIVYKFIPTISC